MVGPGLSETEGWRVTGAGAFTRSRSASHHDHGQFDLLSRHRSSVSCRIETLTVCSLIGYAHPYLKNPVYRRSLADIRDQVAQEIGVRMVNKADLLDGKY